jgi:hypothetical protein
VRLAKKLLLPVTNSAVCWLDRVIGAHRALLALGIGGSILEQELIASNAPNIRMLAVTDSLVLFIEYV